jgi:hypothetical protein
MILLFVIILLLHIIFTYHVHINGKRYYNNRINNQKIKPKIYDTGFKYIPDYSNIKILEHIINIFPVVLLIIFGYNVFIKSLKLITFIIMLRWIFTSLTILPKYTKCDDSSFSFRELINGHCYDKVFSGHFATLLLVLLIAYDLNKLNMLSLVLISIIYSVLLIAIRFHYTVDIGVATIISLLIFTHRNKLYSLYN